MAMIIKKLKSMNLNKKIASAISNTQTLKNI